MPIRATRRTFLKLSAAAASVTAVQLAHAKPGKGRIFIATLFDSDYPLKNTEPLLWATDKLRAAIAPEHTAALQKDADFTIAIHAATYPLGKPLPNLLTFTQAETIALIPTEHEGTPAVFVAAADIRGLVYGILELADRVRNSDNPITALHLPAPIIETTPNKVRSVARAFVSEIEDKPWFYDRAFWTNYLDTLVAARFNRFNFTLGIGYDFPKGVTGDYLHFPYPYLVELPAYPGVHVEPALAPGERQRNLETLQFIAAETARRGLEFQLGIWTHAYQWTDSPHSDHQIVGLTPETHAAYCRDALAALLAACPQITGLTLRIHGESGIPEGSYTFWQTLFDAIPAARTPEGKPRVIEIDMHAKGLNQIMIDMARKTGMPVKAGAKYWAEHLGLGYQQADIRATEYPREGVTGTFAVSSGARNFTRYGYGDFYQYPQGRPAGESIDLLYRVWPGTQRHLLWGDPALAAGYGRAANFCGAAGMEIMEPLTFKGREGSGHPGGRDAYADATLGPANLDSAKFTVTYMLWGRYLYNPDTAPDFHHRYLAQVFGPAGPALETALAASSRILPLVTTAWCPSASNHEFWPEMLTPVSILPYTTKPLYGDSPAPHNVSAISPLDPQLFSTIEQHAQNLNSGKSDARYNTSEVIAWLESLVATSTAGLAAARKAAGTKFRTPEFRRAEEDILILNGLGTYYANLFRAALYYSINFHQPEPDACAQCSVAYRSACDAWAAMAKRAQTIYAPDISYGSTPFRRGHWADRLGAINSDLAVLEKGFGDWSAVHPGPGNSAMLRIARPNPRAALTIHHTAPESFHPGEDLWLTIATQRPIGKAILWYRHVNQGERWLSTPMQSSAETHTAAIPAAYSASPYPLQYYFELRTTTAATLHPPFNPTLSNQPYFAIHKRT
jgi:hypothetical protein